MSNEIPPSVPQTINMSEKELDGFDYDGVRKLYFEELKEIEKSKIAAKLLWNKKLLYDKILETKISTPIGTMYEVITVEGEDWLIQRRSVANDKIVRIIPSEFCFDIISRAHIQTGHGNAQLIESAISSLYIYPKFCIPIVVKYCNVCRSTPVGVTEGMLENCWYLSIVEMGITEEAFQYVMIYIETHSEYILLRPLISKSVDEVSMELLKIFLVFGVPNTVMTTHPLLNFVISVADKILTNCPWIKFEVSKICGKESMLKHNTDNILGELNNWIAETGCNKWAIGCHIVQWKVNTTRKIIPSPGNGTIFAIDIPYNCFFRNNVNVFNHANRKELLEQERNKTLNQNDSVIDIDGLNSVNKLMYTEESTIVDEKKTYTTCCVCNNNMLIQYKCWFCQKPIHSDCGTIMRNSLKRKRLYTVRCKFCIINKGLIALALQLD